MQVRELGRGEASGEIGAPGRVPPGIMEIVPRRFGDDRGSFSEVWNRAAFREVGLERDWCQDNQSLSRPVGTLRGLHYQLAPNAQTKLVRVLAGRILDVVVDIRPGSPTLGGWAGLEISDEVGNQVLVPSGYAHGFVTLEPDTVVLYKVDAPYSPRDDRAVRWDDPAIGLPWPLGRNGLPQEPILSGKDAAAPSLADAVAELEALAEPEAVAEPGARGA